MKSDLQLNGDAVKLRERFAYDNKQPIGIFELISAREEYTVIRIPFSENISGMCICDNHSRFIALNSNMSLGRQRFTAAHELYHLEIENVKQGTICGMDMAARKQDSEKEADRFASYFLMPYDGLEWYVGAFGIQNWNVENVMRLSQYYKISYLATLFRLKQDGRISEKEFAELTKKNVRSEAAKIGIETSLYEIPSGKEGAETYGQYVRLLEQLNTDGKITAGLYNQFCREGFCHAEVDYLKEKEEWNYD